jgi:hypothetical protein
MEDVFKKLQDLKDSYANCPLPELRENGTIEQYYQEHVEYDLWATEMEAKIEELENIVRIIKDKL